MHTFDLYLLNTLCIIKILLQHPVDMFVCDVMYILRSRYRYSRKKSLKATFCNLFRVCATRCQLHRNNVIHIFICVTSTAFVQKQTHTAHWLHIEMHANASKEWIKYLRFDKTMLYIYFFFSFDNVRLNNINVRNMGSGLPRSKVKLFLPGSAADHLLHILYSDDPPRNVRGRLRI